MPILYLPTYISRFFDVSIESYRVEKDTKNGE